ncbi:MAG: hypothetical protein ACYC3B_04365 [Sedimentisphaerales bacterium]
MDTLTKEQRDILLDYYFECANQNESEIARGLLENHQGAVEFFSRLHDSLSPLEHLNTENDTNCPDHLVEKTLAGIYSQSQSSDEPVSVNRLKKLLAEESQKVATKRSSFWKGLAETVGVAAAILIMSGIFVPVSRNMRAHAWQTACQANLSKIARGFTQYAGDNQGFLPAVATKAGSPWWRVGSEGQESQSNTRHLWLLVRNGYAEPEAFTCQGCARGKTIKLDRGQLVKLPDFPNRRYISYSFKLISDSNRAAYPKSATPLMSDANPIFESCLKTQTCLSKGEFEPIRVCEKLAKINSYNHRTKGQNIMFSDGAVRFTTQRIFGQNDDIFTVRDLNIYRGNEKPNTEADIFLVP